MKFWGTSACMHSAWGRWNGSVSLPQSPLEKREKLEQLRFLENGVPIRVVRVEGYEAHGVDTPEDLETIRELLAEHTCKSCVR